MIQMGETRPTCPNCGWVHYEDPKVAVAVIIMEDRRILLVRRIMEPQAHRWSLPAGFVNAREDPVQAAARECREETGLEVAIGDLFQMQTGREHDRGADILLIYRARVTRGTLRAGDDADQAAWFSLDTLPELAFESTKKVIASLKAK
jgi:ADP-ribose pyrophosphatase YjhB (NUDIX family)